MAIPGTNVQVEIPQSNPGIAEVNQKCAAVQLVDLRLKAVENIVVGPRYDGQGIVEVASRKSFPSVTKLRIGDTVRADLDTFYVRLGEAQQNADLVADFVVYTESEVQDEDIATRQPVNDGAVRTYSMSFTQKVFAGTTQDLELRSTLFSGNPQSVVIQNVSLVDSSGSGSPTLQTIQSQDALQNDRTQLIASPGRSFQDGSISHADIQSDTQGVFPYVVTQRGYLELLVEETGGNDDVTVKLNAFGYAES